MDIYYRSEKEASGKDGYSTQPRYEKSEDEVFETEDTGNM